MVTKYMMPAATFHTSNLKADLNKIVTKMMGVQQHGKKEKDNFLRSRRRKLNLSPTEKLNLRRARNKMAAHASREKAKIGENLLKQQLFHLKYEKMKLLLEIEALKKKSSELELDNECMKFKAQILKNRSIDEGNDVEDTIKHAWFVNVPLLKEWVLLKIFIILLIAAVLEAVKKSAIILNYWMLNINMYLNWSSSLQYLPSQMCQMYLQWEKMIPLAGFLHNPLILNG